MRLRKRTNKTSKIDRTHMKDPKCPKCPECIDERFNYNLCIGEPISELYPVTSFGIRYEFEDVNDIYRNVYNSRLC